MRLVEQVVLVYARGRSEKVYEVDLCEVGAGKWVVNFRYGRRGSPLKDGTKTLTPVSEAAARAEYNKLVESKTKAGYTQGDAHAVAPEPATATPVASATSITGAAPVASATPVAGATPPAPRSRPVRVANETDPRRKAILERLARGDGRAERQSLPSNLRHLAFRRAAGSKDWSLSRAIWRAGELEMASAVGLLVPLIGGPAKFRNYSIAWSLGRCGDVGNAEAIAALRALRRKPRISAWLERITTSSLMLLLDEGGQSSLRSELAATLPAALGLPALSGTPEEAIAAVCAHLGGDELKNQDPDAWAVLETLYLMNTEASRAAVLDIVTRAKVAPPAFQRLRAVFKLSEHQRDGRTFGAIAYRFEKTSAMYTVSPWGTASVPDRSGRGRTRMGAEQLQSMLRSARPTAAFGSKTRWYLRQRVWRTLRRMGDLEDPNYVKMAVGVLQPFADDDVRSGWSWPLSHILWRHSNRYSRGRKGWHRTRGASQVATTREEAYPKLWDAQPGAVLHLIDESECEAVHEFAVLVLRDHADLCRSLPVDAVAMLLGRPFAVTARFGFELAQRRYRPGAAESEIRALALAVSNCALAEIRREGHSWVRDNAALFLRDAPFLAALAASKHPDSRQFGRDFIHNNRIASNVAESLVVSLIAHVVGCGGDDAALATDLALLLREQFSDRLTSLGDGVIDDLINHSLAVVQVLGGQLLLARGPAHPPSESAVAKLLDSEHADVQAVGVQVLGMLDDATLLDRENLLWSLCVHKERALREGIRPTIKRLAASNAEFGAKFLQMLVASLLRRRLAEGVSGHVVALLREDFTALLIGVPTDVVWRLLRSGSTAAQELGGVLLPTHLDADTVPIAQLVELASHDVLSVRQAALQVSGRIVPRLKDDLAIAVRLLDAKWEDSRVAAFKLFEGEFEKSDFSPGILVSICDSVRPDVQRFGRKLIQMHFDEGAGQEYLLKLAEHPAADVQLFATNFLERYASDSVDRLDELAPYFTRVLSQVNRGHAARKRAQGFLRGEGLRNEECARVVTGILERHSATMAIEDRAAAIETLVLIARAFPQIRMPLIIRPVECRKAAS